MNYECDNGDGNKGFMEVPRPILYMPSHSSIAPMACMLASATRLIRTRRSFAGPLKPAPIHVSVLGYTEYRKRRRGPVIALTISGPILRLNPAWVAQGGLVGR